MKKFLIAISLITLVSAGITAGLTGKAAPEVNSAGVAYLKTKSNSAWKTMALVAAGETGLSGDHLKNVTSANAIDYCAPILAITALNQDPRTYPNQDYVAKLNSFWDGTQLGDAGTLNDDIFGLLALISSGEPTGSDVIAGTKNYILAQQNADHGWGFAPGGDSDTNMTGMAIMALLETGLTASDPAITNAVTYLQSAQNDDAGFPWSPTSPWGTDSDASSDAWVISTLYKLGQNPETWARDSANPITHLKSLQDPLGFFKFQEGTTEDAFSPITTSYAVIALAGKSYPINKITYTPTETFSLRIEGTDATICQGEFIGPTALDIVKNAAEICNFTYEIEDTGFGDYLKKINDEEAQGMSGWLYFVNNESPPVGAADYNLETGDQVLWYYGDWAWFPLKVEASQTEVASGASITATVSSYTGGSWSPLESATLKAGSQEFITDQNGQVTLTLDDAYYRLYAQATGYVRSNKLTLKFGEPSAQTIDLEVDITGETGGAPGGDPPPGPPQEDEVSFSVDISDVSFGALKPGQVSSKNVSLTNQSDDDLYLETIVTGADIFQDNLYLDNQYWALFGLNLLQGENHNAELKLSIPANYSSFGSKSGAITFWAIVE